VTDPVKLHLPRPGRLLVVAAHPDDAGQAMGGTVAAWVAAGTAARLVCCTSGEAAAADPGADPLEVAAMREREERASATVIGYEEVTFLHRPEGAVADDLALREQLVRIIRTFRPDVVATHDPRPLVHPWGGVNHLDHRAAGSAAIDAVVPDARTPLAFPQLARSEGLAPHAAGALYLFWPHRPAAAVDIGDQLEVKLRALPEERDDRRREWGREQVRAAASVDGTRAGVTAAELFSPIDLRS
jgi:LmbE family N-acetylglucosaminyl deacetylase